MNNNNNQETKLDIVTMHDDDSKKATAAKAPFAKQEGVPALLVDDSDNKQEAATKTGTTIVLSHYSETPFALNRARQYQVDPHGGCFKPDGLWLSDDSDENNWKSWCQGNCSCLHELAFETRVHVNLSDNVLHLDGSNPRAVLEFQIKYRPRHKPHGVDWNAVVHDYKGIFISPYCYAVRDLLFWSFETYWFQAWDVPSACIWDLSCIIKTETSQ